jgi:hypothetical protein
MKIYVKLKMNKKTKDIISHFHEEIRGQYNTDVSDAEMKSNNKRMLNL